MICINLLVLRRNHTLHLLNFLIFFFNDTATTEIYTLSLHDALPIWTIASAPQTIAFVRPHASGNGSTATDRKSTRLNSSHSQISYAVFCLKKKKNKCKKKEDNKNK